MDLIHLLMQVVREQPVLVSEDDAGFLVRVADLIFSEDVLRRLARVDKSASWAEEFLEILRTTCRGSRGWEPIIDVRLTRQDELAELLSRKLSS